ncbi:MAG: hypothetical protein BZY79_03710 [SAR202 cluster bacterium Casp-Chloro-G4]|nr:response regulator [Chloroflexota bacterium]PKB61479.1 MAG: hypothetical protein BZY79_03710 [SAR202 cluster bacterium Casp-Chloro-G4]
MTIGFAEPKTTSALQEQTQKTPLEHPSILVVEDEEGVRDLLVQLLQMGGYSAIAVDNGLDAIASFKEEHYDLVFTDYRMPGISGAEVTRAIKAFDSRIPVVVVTGWDPETFKDELECAGADHILQKPFDMDDLLELVSSLTSR